jgi:transglutaminase-like putative cysteine protease
MLYSIKHTTSYSYDSPIFLEAQTIRLQPRSDAAQRVVSYASSVSPRSQVITHLHITDIEGTPSQVVWIGGTTDHFDITCESVVETLRANPYDFLLERGCTHFPANSHQYYTPELRLALAPYILSPGNTTANGEEYERSLNANQEIIDLARQMADAAGNNVTAFLAQSCEWIYQSIEPEVRLEGSPMLASETLNRKKGSCRDVAVLFMDICRAMGLATRFVSGYFSGAVYDDGIRHLHAWTEVYLPGAGWRGFDPSYGTAVADLHIACAAAYTPHLASPVSGTYRGVKTASQLSYHITINEESAAELAHST